MVKYLTPKMSCTIGKMFVFVLMCFFELANAQTGYISYSPGTLNVVLSSPHGGDVRADTIPDRDAGCWDDVNSACVYSHSCENKDPALCGVVTTTDMWTRELTEILESELESITGKKPHVIINNLHRIKLDANRDIGEAAFGVPLAEDAWREYHDYINQAKTAISGPGLFFDIHGQAHAEDWIELGYLFTSSQLDSGDLDPTRSSIRSLASKVNITFENLLRGPKSFGGYLNGRDYTVVPSPNNPSPDGGAYFSGGYNTKVHGSRDGGVIDAIQIESPRSLRNEIVGPDYARDLAQVVDTYLKEYYKTH